MFPIPYWLSPGWWVASAIRRACSYSKIDPKYWAWTGAWLVQQLFNLALVAAIGVLASR
jgi:hypothetical protein